MLGHLPLEARKISRRYLTLPLKCNESSSPKGELAPEFTGHDAETVVFTYPTPACNDEFMGPAATKVGFLGQKRALET